MILNEKFIIQVAGVIDKTEAEMLINQNVRYLGFPLRLPVHEEDLSENEAAEIAKNLPEGFHPVLITYLNEAEEIVSFAETVGMQIVQLHGEISVNELKKTKELAPDLKIIKSLVIKPGNQNELEININELSPYVDAFITDTFDPETGASGATGKTHDWEISKRFVEISPKPVILAGGLNPGNVYEAIKFVKPAGVDSHTSVENNSGRKDAALISEFINQATKAFIELGSLI